MWPGLRGLTAASQYGSRCPLRRGRLGTLPSPRVPPSSAMRHGREIGVWGSAGRKAGRKEERTRSLAGSNVLAWRMRRSISTDCDACGSLSTPCRLHDLHKTLHVCSPLLQPPHDNRNTEHTATEHLVVLLQYHTPCPHKYPPPRSARAPRPEPSRHCRWTFPICRRSCNRLLLRTRS